MTINEIINDRIESINRQLKESEEDYISAKDYYLKEITETTPLVNIFNVVNHAAEIKKLKFAREQLKQILWMVEMSDKTK